MSAVFYLKRPGPRPELVRATDDVFITSQLTPGNIRFLSFRFKTIVDLRPDGEAKDQPTSSDMELAARTRGKDFHYIPVPHENIPDDAVNKLREVLSHSSMSTVLYCRTGRRAARTLALAQASQADGPTADEILQMVKTAGFSAEDLKQNITERIAHRNSLPGEKEP